MRATSRPSPSRDGRMIVVTLRGAMMLGVGIVLFSTAYIAGWPELLILATFCLVLPLLALAVVAGRRPRFTVVRSTTPPIATVATTATARIHITSEVHVRSGAVRWSDDLPWGDDRTKWREVPAIGAGEEFTLRHDFVPPRRGISELGPLVAEVTDPFGLARGELALGGTSRLVVAPPSVDLGSDLDEIAVESGLARLFQHRALAGDHDIMTRGYRPGDPINRVHWKATAHHDELMVREDEKRSHAEAVIVLDSRRRNWRDALRQPSPTRSDSESFEWALSFTLSLRNFLVRNGLSVRVVETAARQLADATNTFGFVESLARVQLSYRDGEALHFAQRPTESIGSLFAVLDAPDANTIDALTEQSGFGLTAAFTTGPRNPNLDERLTLAGWQVHRVQVGESVLTAWQSLIAGERDA